MKKKLNSLQVGERGVIYSLKTKDTTLYRKLLNLGFIPGNQVQVILTFPIYLVQIEFSQIALDKELCGVIEVMLQAEG